MYLDVCGVRNPSTKGRNVRYRLACSPGWGCVFTLLWDKTLVDRNTMRTVLKDASILVGLGDGRSVGNGRFEVLKFEELTDAEETTTEGSVESAARDRLESGQAALHETVLPDAAETNGSATFVYGQCASYFLPDGMAEAFYGMLHAAPSKGRWVNQFLRGMPYAKIIDPTAEAPQATNAPPPSRKG